MCDRSGDDADAGRQDQAGRRGAVLFGLVRLRQGRGGRQGAREAAAFRVGGRLQKPQDLQEAGGVGWVKRSADPTPNQKLLGHRFVRPNLRVESMSIWDIYKRALAMLVVE